MEICSFGMSRCCVFLGNPRSEGTSEGRALDFIRKEVREIGQDTHFYNMFLAVGNLGHALYSFVQQHSIQILHDLVFRIWHVISQHCMDGSFLMRCWHCQSAPREE